MPRIFETRILRVLSNPLTSYQVMWCAYINIVLRLKCEMTFYVTVKHGILS